MDNNLKQTFTLGGFNYTAPIKIGAGIRARFAEKQMDMILKGEHSSKMLKSLKDVSGDTDEALKNKYLDMAQAFTFTNGYNISLLILETVLTPAEGSPSIKEAYEIATEEEANKIISFFSGQAPTPVKTTNKNKK